MTNQDLIEKLISEKSLLSPKIIDAFKAIPREDFVLPEDQGKAYEDRPFSIGYGATISQPTTVAIMLEELQPEAGQKILEIGTGSGYLTALLAKIIGDPSTGSGQVGQVFSIEYIPELKNLAESNLKKYDFKNVELFVGDGKAGLKDFSPFDRIISSASAIEIPESWKRQLAIGGRIVVPVQENLVVLDKASKNRFKEKINTGFLFVPLK
ncbi:MAG: protein-L-isoaspartate O-methyltransferase [Patescibacteria group bacterium]